MERRAATMATKIRSEGSTLTRHIRALKRRYDYLVEIRKQGYDNKHKTEIAALKWILEFPEKPPLKCHIEAFKRRLRWLEQSSYNTYNKAEIAALKWVLTEKVSGN